jgi:hypothetical protein
MARKPIKTSPAPGERPAQPSDQLNADRKVDLSAALSSETTYVGFDVWIVGVTPLIVHAWSLKAKKEMLTKQAKAVRGQGREKRNPEQDFIDSIYEMPDDKLGRKAYGFPATGLKKAFLSAAHKDKGLARTSVLSNLWVNSEMVRVRTAYEKAICDLPLVRVYGGDPVMREDMVRIGSGITKKSNLAYRAQFWPWAINLTGRFNEAMMTDVALAFLIRDSGLANGVGEWRNEKSGVFGSFAVAGAEEAAAWRAYAAGKGPLPSFEIAEAAE